MFLFDFDYYIGICVYVVLHGQCVVQLIIRNSDDFVVFIPCMYTISVTRQSCHQLINGNDQ